MSVKCGGKDESWGLELRRKERGSILEHNKMMQKLTVSVRLKNRCIKEVRATDRKSWSEMNC